MPKRTAPVVRFSKWYAWKERDSIPDLTLPGVYVLARFENRRRPPRGSADPLSRSVVYIGETCRQLKKRLRAFHRSAFRGKRGHNGGVTYRKLYGGPPEHLCIAAFGVGTKDPEMRSLLIPYVERKLLWDFGVRWGKAPACNKE